jgi:dihydroxyacetone kinase
MSIQTKHLLNSPDSLVLDALSGLCTLNHALSLDKDNKIVHLANQDRSKVALICGGGSGHEPSHSGFVGEGVLTAAVCGNIFASPNASQVRRAIDLVHNEKGTVIIVKYIMTNRIGFTSLKPLQKLHRRRSQLWSSKGAVRCLSSRLCKPCQVCHRW